MIPREVASLVEHNMAAAQVLERAASAPRSACCSAVIQGAAAKWCGGCGATLDHETNAPLRGAR